MTVIPPAFLRRAGTVGKPPEPPSLATLSRAISRAKEQPSSVVARLLQPENPYVDLSKMQHDTVNSEVMDLVKAMSAEKRGAPVIVPERTASIYEVPQKSPLSIRENFSGDLAAKAFQSNPSLPFILYNKEGKTKVAYRDGDTIKSRPISKEIKSGDEGAIFSSKGFSALPQSVRADLVKASGRGTVPCGTNSNTVCDANGQLIEIPRNQVFGELPVITMTAENRQALSKTLNLEKGEVAVFVARDEAGKEQTVGVFKYSDAKGELKTKVVPIPIAADKVPKEVRANFVSIMDALDPPENAPAPPPRASLKPNLPPTPDRDLKNEAKAKRFNAEPENVSAKKKMDDMGRVTILGEMPKGARSFPVNHIPISNGGLPWTSQESLNIDLKPEVDIAFRLGKDGGLKGMYKDAEGKLKSIPLTVRSIPGERGGYFEMVDMPSGADTLPKGVKMNLTKAVTEWNKQKEADFKGGYIEISAEPELPQQNPLN